MSKYHYSLAVIFDIPDDGLIYDGLSFYNSQIVDELVIRKNEIRIKFERVKKMPSDKAVFSPESPARYQFYRAVCFYLSVTGHLPNVREVIFSRDDYSEKVDSVSLTKNWADCYAKITLNAADAAKCFGRDGQRVYAAITYFLKAQLDAFSHDRFRAAWSGLNALYSGYSDSSRESDKLAKLSDRLEKYSPKNAVCFVKSLPEEEFWDRLKWYSFVSGNIELIKEKLFKSNFYRDRIIYAHLTKYTSVLYKGDECIEKKKMAEKRSRKKVNDIDERVRFLVCQYSYFLRNRSFHASKPYPLFGLFSEESPSVENQITTLLLYTIKDLIETVE